MVLDVLGLVVCGRDFTFIYRADQQYMTQWMAASRKLFCWSFGNIWVWVGAIDKALNNAHIPAGVLISNGYWTVLVPVSAESAYPFW
jgi:hypothetical protein